MHKSSTSLLNIRPGFWTTQPGHAVGGCRVGFGRVPHSPPAGRCSRGLDGSLVGGSTTATRPEATQPPRRGDVSWRRSERRPMDGIDSRLEGDHRQRKASIPSRGSHFNAEAPTATPWLQCGGGRRLGTVRPHRPCGPRLHDDQRSPAGKVRPYVRGTRTGNLRRAVGGADRPPERRADRGAARPGSPDPRGIPSLAPQSESRYRPTGPTSVQSPAGAAVGGGPRRQSAHAKDRRMPQL